MPAAKQEPQLALITEEIKEEEDSESSEIIKDYKKLNDKICGTLLKIKERKTKKYKK